MTDGAALREQCGRVAAECACVNLRKAARAVTQSFDAAFRSSGIRATQFTMLVAVAVADPATMTRLAEALVMDRTTLTRNLRPLARRGLIKIVRGADRRTRTVTLTSRGRGRLGAAMTSWERVQGQVLHRVGARAWRGLLGRLSAMVDLAGAS